MCGVCIYIYVCMYVYMYVCMYVCVYVCCRNRILATFWPFRGRIWSRYGVQILLSGVSTFVLVVSGPETGAPQ